MRNLARIALRIGAAALFAGCGGSQPVVAPLTPVVNKSGHAPGARSLDLLYV